VGDDAVGGVAEGELGVAEQGGVGGGHEASGHVQDVGGRAGGDAGGQFLGAGFQFGRQWLSHREAPAGRQFPGDARTYAEVNPFTTNFRDAYPR
jgi:hypothetical protein